MADLVNAGVEFMACDNPLATKETASLLAETAAKEAEQIRQRTLNKMAQLKKAGVKLGSARPGHWKGHEDKRGWKKAVKASTRQRLQRTQDYYAFLVPEIKQMRDEGKSYEEIVDTLNAAGHRTTKGSEFTQTSIYRLICRYLGKEYLGRVRPGGRPKKEEAEAVPA